MKIYAADLDEEALEYAQRAVYTARETANVPPALLDKYFEKNRSLFHCRSRIRRAVIFARHNRLQDPPISRIALLACRNAQMYFDAKGQKQGLMRMHYALRDSGVLILGKAETLAAYSALFSRAVTDGKPNHKRTIRQRGTNESEVNWMRNSKPGSSGEKAQLNGESYEEKWGIGKTRAKALTKKTAQITEPNVLLSAAFQELNTTLEELQVAEEELRQQNEELLRTQDFLAAERQNYHDLFEFAPNAYLVTDAGGLIQEANAAACLMLGLTKRFLKNKPLANYVADAERMAFRQRLLSLKDMSPETVRFPLTVKPRSAETLPAEAVVTHTREKSGVQATLRWILQDLSPQIQAEQDRLALAQEQAVQQAAYERERRIAEILQRALLRSVPENAFPGLKLATLYEAALAEAQVGGDFFDVFTVDSGKVALVVGDVSGKGLSAAACTAEIRYALRAFLRNSLHPQAALAQLNDFMCEARLQSDWPPDLFASLALAVVDPATGEAQVALAGMEPLLCLHAAGPCEAIEAPGMLLGVEARRMYRQNTLTLEPGDALLMVTDGIMEARRGKTFLGLEGLCMLAEPVKTQEPAQIVQAILQGAQTFATGPDGTGALHDDVCILLARRTA